MKQEEIVSLRLPYPGREDRLVRVFVPAHEEGERFPVIYMTDGQNLFDEESSGFGCWHTREAVRALREDCGQAAVIVGIHNADPWRTNELMPGSIGEPQVPEEDRAWVRPQGEIFDAFLCGTVMPAVEARFPVRTGRENTAFCGSSMGGLMAFFTALSHPERYCAAGVFSPAFHLYREEDLRRWIYARLGEEMPELLLYSGALDELEQIICRSTEQVYDMLLECYPMEKLYEIILPDQRHHECAWEPRFRDFLRMFYAHQRG